MMMRAFPSFPFDLVRAVNAICGECGYPGRWDEDGNVIAPCSKETCDFFKRERKNLCILHVRVRAAERVIENPLVTATDDAYDDLCGKCAFGTVCTIYPATYWEPPEYGVFCAACQEITGEDEPVECGGRFYEGNNTTEMRK